MPFLSFPEDACPANVDDARFAFAMLECPGRVSWGGTPCLNAGCNGAQDGMQITATLMSELWSCLTHDSSGKGPVPGSSVEKHRGQNDTC